MILIVESDQVFNLVDEYLTLFCSVVTGMNVMMLAIIKTYKIYGILI